MTDSELNTFLSKQAGALETPSLRVITQQVAAVQGINLGQGVCQLPVPEYVVAEAQAAIAEGINRYTSPRGLQSLREALSQKLKSFNGIEADPEREILITIGATGAFEAVCAMCIDPGDEVVSFSPFYPYHHNALNRYNAQVRYVPLERPSFSFSEEALESACSPETKFILVNTPANPSGKVFTETELRMIARVAEKYNALVVTDEIYEYMVFDGQSHLSPASLPELRERTITIGGYSKTFAITGWRIGYAVMPPQLADVAARLLDSIYVCSPAPLQEAVARGIAHFEMDFYDDLREKYRSKRDRFCSGLEKVGLKPLIPTGSYYIVADFSDNYRQYDSKGFVNMMIEQAGVGAVPSSDFVLDDKEEQWIRFCISVEDTVLEKAIDRLGALASSAG